MKCSYRKYSVKYSYCNDCRSLLQGHIYIPEAVAVRHLQHLHTSLQPCCVGHLPRHDGCPVLRAARGSESRRSHRWLNSNSTAVCQWLRADTNWPRNQRRLALMFLHHLSDSLQFPRANTRDVCTDFMADCDRNWYHFCSLNTQIYFRKLFQHACGLFLPDSAKLIVSSVGL